MKIKSTLLTFMAFMLFLNYASAAKWDYTAKFNKCMDAVQTTLDSLVCIDDELKIQEKRLNNIYGKLIRVEPPLRKAELQSAQRLWLQYQKSNCNFYYDPEGGTVAHQLSRNCVLETTFNRANELKFLFELKN